MLVVQEVNRVKGKSLEKFESTTQELWKAAAATGVQAAWYFEVSHGTGPSYCVVTGIRLPDWATWESFARSVAFGELSGLTETLDAARYDSESSVLEILSEVPPPSEEAAASDLWVQRLIDPDAGGEAAVGQPGIVMRGCLGGRPDGITVLTKETPSAVLDLLTGEAGSNRVLAKAESTWVLRPSSWSPLR